MPSSFKRRQPAPAVNAQEQEERPAPAKEPLPAGLRPSPYPSPVPLFSSGLTSFDDIVTGHGIPSSCLVSLCPSVGLAGSSALGIDGAATNSRQLPTSSRTTVEALQAAEQVLLDVSCYGIAQGVLAGHKTLVVGTGVRDTVRQRVPVRATSSRGENNRSVAEDSEDMTIAFRYAHRPRFKTTVDEPIITGEIIPDEHRFRAPFDATRRLSDSELEGSKNLIFIEATNYKDALTAIEREVTSAQAPVRIHLMSLGSQEWHRRAESMESRIVLATRFLLRIRHLLRHLALEKEPATHAICTASISTHLLASPWRALTTQHLLRLADVQLLLSDFTLDEGLKRAYKGYGGSVYLQKGPAIGSVLPPGEERSVLRGGGAEAENDIGWRRKKRGHGVVFETLHEDVDSEQRSEEKGPAAVKPPSRGIDIEDAALGLHRRERPTAQVMPGKQQDGAADAGLEGPKHGHPVKTHSNPAAKRSTGLQSLRERGLRAGQGRPSSENPTN